MDASQPTATIPDFMALIPDGKAKDLVLHCINDLGLSVTDTAKVLYDASKLVSCVDYLLAGGTYLVRPD